MPDFNDPLSAAVAPRGGLYNLDTATQPGGGALDTGFSNLLDQAVNARQNFEERRRYLFDRLQHGHRGERLRSAAELRHMDTLERFAHQQSIADQRQADFEANQRRMASHENALETDRQIRRDRDTRIDEQGADAMVKMHQLETAFRAGQINKDQFDDGMLELGTTHFEALHRHPEAAKHWSEYLDQDNKMSQYHERLNLREAAKLNAKYGVQIQADPNTGEIDFDAMHKAVLATPKGQSEALSQLNGEMVKRYGLPAPAVFQHAAGGRLDNASDVNSFKQTDPNDTQNPQTHVRMNLISPSGTQHNVVMEKPKFDAIKAEFEPAYNQIVSAGQVGDRAPSTQLAPHPQDSAAVEWANSHGDDPRAQRILELNK